MLKNIRLQIGLVVLFLLTLGFGFIVHNRPQTKARSWSPIQPQPIFQNTDKLPISLIENRGQIDSRALYYVQSPGRSMYFTKEGHSLRLSQGKGDDAKAHTIKVELEGAATERVEGLQRSAATVSYFKGHREDWKTIPTHSKIGTNQQGIQRNFHHDGAMNNRDPANNHDGHQCQTGE